jgi:anti-anti-sigma factor
MAASELEARIRHRDGRAIIDLLGDIDRGSDAVLEAAYAEAVEHGSSSIVLNFSGIHYINSTGIAVIVGLLARARSDRRTVLAYGLTDHYREIFEITRLSDFMSIFEDEDNAVAEVSA